MILTRGPAWLSVLSAMLVAVAAATAVIAVPTTHGAFVGQITNVTDTAASGIYADPAINLGLGRTATQSSTLNGGVAGRALDGNTDGDAFHGSISQTNQESQPWWQVDLGASSLVRTVTMWNRTECCSSRLANGKVFLSTTDMTGRTYAQLQADSSVTTLSFGTLTDTSISLAAGDTVARYVRVQLPGNIELALAEVQVFGPNLAGWRPTSQSTTLGGPSYRAVDGNTDGVFNNGSVSHTDIENQPWWQVDLGAAKTVYALTVYNRTDCCGSRLNNAEVLLSTTDMTGRTYAQLAADSSVTRISLGATAVARKTVQASALSTRYVRVQLGSSYDFLHLAEVQVNGMP